MGALQFAGRKLVGIVLVGIGVLVGVSVMFSGGLSQNAVVSVIGLVIILAGIVFGLYFWKSADRHV